MQVDGLVAKTPALWDDVVWAAAKKTVLTDQVIDGVLDYLLARLAAMPEEDRRKTFAQLTGDVPVV